MNATDEKNDPSTPSLEYQAMAQTWAKLSVVLAGLDALRRAGTTYLPQHAGESDDQYQQRLNQTRFWPATKKTLSDLSSMPFTKPVQLGKDVPAQLVQLAENIDQCGRNLDVFAREWFSQALGKGLSWVLIDAPQAPESRSVADDTVLGVRPYWVLYAPENVIDVVSVFEEGRHKVVEARIKVIEIERDGFAQVTVERIYHRTPGMVQIYQKDEQQDKWIPQEPITIQGQTEVPLVRFSTDLVRRGEILVEPPLGDLADLNLAHYRSLSDQVNALTVARFPLLACSGDTPGEKIVLSPNKLLSSDNHQATFYYVEHSGAALDKGLQDLQDLEAKMESYGGMLLRKQPGSPTATGEALEAAETLSHLESTILLFKHALETALMLTAKWIGLDSGGSVELKHKISELPSEQGESTLVAAYNGKAISTRAFVTELMRRNILSDEHDFDEDLKERDQEAQRAIDQAQAMMDIDPQNTEGEEDDGEAEAA